MYRNLSKQILISLYFCYVCTTYSHHICYGDPSCTNTFSWWHSWFTRMGLTLPDCSLPTSSVRLPTPSLIWWVVYNCSDVSNACTHLDLLDRRPPKRWCPSALQQTKSYSWTLVPCHILGSLKRCWHWQKDTHTRTHTHLNLNWRALWQMMSFCSRQEQTESIGYYHHLQLVNTCAMRYPGISLKFTTDGTHCHAYTQAHTHTRTYTTFL